ncbi:unnamed protein product [Rhodiola kirilowii]
MDPYRWKSFYDDEDRPEKPRRFGVTEMSSPGIGHGSLFGQGVLQDIFETMGQFVDGLRISEGSSSLMAKKELIKEITNMAHKHDVYVSTSDWADHLLQTHPSAFKDYVEECKLLGLDTIELNAGLFGVCEDTLLRYVRLVKTGGLRAKPQFSVKFNKSDIPAGRDRAFGAYVFPEPRSSEVVEDVDFMIRRAERCMEAGADMVMIDAKDVCKHPDSVRADIIAKIVGRLGLEKTMFGASDARTAEWFIRQYGPKVNLYVDHAYIIDLECLRGSNLGQTTASIFGPKYFLL